MEQANFVKNRNVALRRKSPISASPLKLFLLLAIFCCLAVLSQWASWNRDFRLMVPVCLDRDFDGFSRALWLRVNDFLDPESRKIRVVR
jgi:hypothetical protein